MLMKSKKKLDGFSPTLVLILILIISYNNDLVLAPSIEVDYSFSGALTVRLINHIMSTPIRFVYRDFSSVDRLFCKYINSTSPFASFKRLGGLTPADRVLEPISTDYEIVNSSIGVEGYFGVKIKANIDRDNDNAITCQYSTRFTIGSSSRVTLQVIAPVKITPFMNPKSPSVGDRVEAGCIIEGFPFPVVEISPPKNFQYLVTQINNSSTKLSTYKYTVIIPVLDSSLIGERIYCSAFQIGGTSSGAYVTIGSKSAPSLLERNPVLVTGLAIGGSIGVALLVITSVAFIIFYRRRASSRRVNRNRFAARGIYNNDDDEPTNTNPKPNEFNQPSDEYITENIDGRIYRANDRLSTNYEVSTAAFV